MRKNESMPHRVREFIANLDGLNIETINQCNYADVHKKCPVKQRFEKFGPQRLSMEILQKLFAELNELGFCGRVGLHHYSEPLMDDRIEEIVILTKQTLPRGKINIWSNGSTLTYELGLMLMEGGVSWLRLSAYSDSEFARLQKIVEGLKKKFPDADYDLVRQELDNRKSLYNNKIINREEPCWDMRELLIINSLGDLELCCRDYMCTYSFGNIYKQTLRDILLNSEYMPMKDDLVNGHRFKYDLCSRCEY